MAQVSPAKSTPTPELIHGPLFDLDIEKLPKKKKDKTVKDMMSTASHESQTSESATLMSHHAMKMGCYEINLGTEQGQKLHTIHLVFLPLVPILILLIQNYTTFDSNKATINDLTDVFLQVQNSLDFAELTKKLQQERVSVALNFFIKSRKRESLTPGDYSIILYVQKSIQLATSIVLLRRMLSLSS